MGEQLEEAVRFGGYQLLRPLAQGGMAELFLAEPPAELGLPSRVVVKRMLPQCSKDQDFQQMFLQEARLAAQLNHEGCVRVFDLGMEEGHLYLGMEYIEGKDLARLLREEGPLPSVVAARLVSEVCTALDYAHRAIDLQGRPMGIVHRDVTPSNIMVSAQGRVKLVDFGIAKASTRFSTTPPGVVKGKLSYVPPEAIRGEELDRRADLFSLGVSLYELITGIKPFERPQLLDCITAILKETPPAPATLRPDIPVALSAIAMRAMAKAREDRYATAAELKADLDAFLATVAPVSAASHAERITGTAAPPPTEPEAKVEPELEPKTVPSAPSPAVFGWVPPVLHRRAQHAVPAAPDQAQAPTEAPTIIASRLPLTVRVAGVALLTGLLGTWAGHFVGVQQMEERLRDLELRLGAETKPAPTSSMPASVPALPAPSARDPRTEERPAPAEPSRDSAPSSKRVGAAKQRARG